MGQASRQLGATLLALNSKLETRTFLKQGTEAAGMHTDEYEISLGREIALCRKMLRKLQDALNKRERHYGMTTAAFLQSLEGTCPADRTSLESWQQEYQELQNWQRRLSEYEEVLESLK